MTGRPLVPAACRAALREVLHGRAAAGARDRQDQDVQSAAQRHIAGCSFCAARMRASERLQVPLAARPVAPVELSAPSLLARIHESVVEAAEAGPIGALLDRSSVPMPDAAEQPQLEQVFGGGAGRLAEQLHARPEEPEEKVWSAVQSSILHEVASQARRAPMRWPVVAAGLAASAFLAVLAVHIAGSGGFSGNGAPDNGTSDEVPIVFTELDQPPDVEFAVLRYGSSR